MKSRRFIGCIAALLVCFCSTAGLAWQPADGPLKTRWSRDVKPDNVLPEYPRPQMVRKDWTNLNGLWQYAIRPAGRRQAGEVGRRDPGAVSRRVGAVGREEAGEARSSGCGIAARFDRRQLARRAAPAAALRRGRLGMHGVGQRQASRRAHGRLRSVHVRYYRCARKTARTNSSSPSADPTDTGTQPRGKQVLKPHGILYTAVTGIWQTVWLEPVPEQHIRVAQDRAGCRSTSVGDA